MRIGIYPPFADLAGNLLDADGIAERARMIEAAGLDGIWLGDHLPIPGSPQLGRPDALMILLLAARATTSIEIGTNIFCVPIRNRYDVLQHLYTLETLFPRRFTIGVGTSSQRGDYEAVGLDWEDRFRLMREVMDEIRAMCEKPEGNLGTADSSMVGTWAQIVGLPRMILGAWSSAPQLRRAVADYDGWMTSGMMGLEGVGWRKSFSEAIKRYRDLGGTRAMVSTVSIDLRQPSTGLADTGMFTLQCPPEEAAERLNFLSELGYDDVILNRTNKASTVRSGAHMHDYTAEDLEEFRSLVPHDTRTVVG